MMHDVGFYYICFFLHVDVMRVIRLVLNSPNKTKC